MTTEQILSILRNIDQNLAGDLNALTREQLVFKLDITRQYIGAILKSGDKQT